MTVFEKNYFYYPPNKPQFYFPKSYFSQFSNYYLPYSFKSRVFWWLFKSFSIFRNIFLINEKSIPLPISEVKRIINDRCAICFYNLGTEGEEQKSTIIAHSNDQKVFLKIAQQKTATNLINNEARVLKEISELNVSFAPELIRSGKDNGFTYLMTNIIEGRKPSSTKLTSELLEVMVTLSKHQKKKDGLILSFNHGDFCPWNILLNKNNNIILIDWEMAGYKPLGYDLFTYLFQTNFLLNPKKSANQIIVENKTKINFFFENFGITNWATYLSQFAMIKIQYQELKKENWLTHKYKQILVFDDKD
jgi:thiamine kinase-like enzyme